MDARSLFRTAGDTPHFVVSEGGQIVEPPFVPYKRQLITAWSGMQNSAPIGMQSGGAYTLNQGRTRGQIGNANCRDIAFHDMQAYMTPGSGLIVDGPPNGATIRRAIEVGTTTTLGLYGGSSAGVLMSPGGRAVSDILNMTLAAESQPYFRFTRAVPTPASDTLSGFNMNAPGSQGFRTIGGSQLGGNGTMNNSGSGSGPALWPWMVSGIPDVMMSAFRVIGDSIAQYLNDTNTSTTGGYIKRGMASVGGHPAVWQYVVIDGNRQAQMIPSVSPQALLDLEYMSHVIMECITNDIAAGTDFATIQQRFISFATQVKTTLGPYDLPVMMIAMCCLNRSGFTGAMNTIKNQYNDWILAGAIWNGRRYCDYAIDMRPYQGDPALYSDGTHPRTADHIAMSIPFAEALVPCMNPRWRPIGYDNFITVPL
jgi:hypothetical protein